MLVTNTLMLTKACKQLGVAAHAAPGPLQGRTALQPNELESSLLSL